ncbi:hypothetical protein FRC11_007483 [Ceratobasidium sp. 423]|nr:hypothetical protein FRC11_007483 [Ceratobasidium sp. 423]
MALLGLDLHHWLPRLLLPYFRPKRPVQPIASPGLEMECEPTYTVLIQDEKFTLSHSQIKFDSPNYFTMCFLGDFSEAQSRSVQLTRSPEIFPLIRQYLCGYMVLPLNDHIIPKGMTATQTIANLRADALFYQLEGLVLQCDAYLEPVKKGLPAAHRFLLVGWEVSKDEPVDILSLDVGDIGKHLPTPKQLGWHLYVTRQELDKLAFKMTMREEFIKGGAEGLSALTSLTCVVDKILPRDARRRWVVGVHLNKYGDKGKEEDGDEQSEDEGSDEDEEDEEGEGDAENEDRENGEAADEEDSDEEDWVDEDEEDGKFDGFNGEIIVIMLEE